MVSSKIRITLDAADVRWLRRRAKSVHGGDLSAVIAEAVRVLRRRVALRTFLEHEKVPWLSPAELAEIELEWR